MDLLSRRVRLPRAAGPPDEQLVINSLRTCFTLLPGQDLLRSARQQSNSKCPDVERRPATEAAGASGYNMRAAWP